MSQSPHPRPEPSTAVGHETRDVTFRPIVWGGIGVLIFAVFMFIFVRLLFGHYVTRQAQESAPANPLASTYGRQEPPEPRLQTAPVQDLRHLRAAEEATLGSYAWVDRKAGVVRLPIERAKDLLAERGLPAPAAPPAAPSEPQQ